MAKDIFSAYRSVCRDLTGLEAYRPIAYGRLKAAHEVMFKGRMPSSIMCYVPLDKALEYYNQAADDFNETVKAIDQLTSVKSSLEDEILQMSELGRVISALHDEQGMSLRKIADKTNYSYSHIRNTRYRMRKGRLSLAQ